jgi:hypothetical protein
MGTRYWEVVCDKNGIGGSGEYCGNNDAHLGRINSFYHGAFGGKYVPRAVFFNLEPGVTGAAVFSRCSANSHVNHTHGQKLGQRALHKGWPPILLTQPLKCIGFCS